MKALTIINALCVLLMIGCCIFNFIDGNIIEAVTNIAVALLNAVAVGINGYRYWRF